MKVPAGTALFKHWICFQDQPLFQKCLTQQEQARSLNSNNSFAVYIWNNVNKPSWDILLKKIIILNSKSHYILVVGDVVLSAR